MADSLRASRTGLEIIDRARRQKGWTKTVTVAWWEDALTSRATLKRFWRQAPIQKEVFIQICRVVGIHDWSAIADPVPALLETVTALQGQGMMPDISGFYGRTTELNQLEQWSLRENCRLITLSGEPGIGKTDLATVFLDSVQDAFTVVKRQSLSHAPTLTTLLTGLLEELPMVDRPTGKDLMTQFIAVISQVRCLLILDGLEAILQQGELSGRYQAGYEDYNEWLKRISSDRHQSCIIVISREQLREVNLLSRRLTSVRSLPLTGLDGEAAKQLLKANGLTDIAAWDALIQQYGTAPQILTLIAAMIVDLFNGSVVKFLQESGTLIIPPTIEQVFQQQFNRLSEPEKTVLIKLAMIDYAVTFSELQELTAISKAVFPSVLESLKGRSLLERLIVADSGDVLFTLQPVIKKFVQRYSYPK